MKRHSKNNDTNGNGSALGAQAIKAMRKAVRDARHLARLHRVPIYIWRDGKTVVDRT